MSRAPEFGLFKQICGINTNGLIGTGTRSWGVYSIDNGTVLKVYSGFKYPISYCQELDLVLRLRNPGIVKAFGVITRDQCSVPDFNHGLIMEHVKCYEDETNLGERLQIFLDNINGLIGLAENDCYHSDYFHRNECVTKIGYKFIDLNGDKFIPFINSRRNYNEIYTYMFELGYDDGAFVDYMEGKGSKPKIIKDPLLSPLQNQLIDDLYNRIYNPDINIGLDIYEIPTHPLFKLYGLTFVPGTEEPRYINLDDWPARHFDWITPLRETIHRLYTKYPKFLFITVMEGIDLYYRHLPFVQSPSELLLIAWNCLYLVGSAGSFGAESYNINDDYDNPTCDRIVKNLNGCLRPRNFYHQARSVKDLLICWQWFGIPYDDYMRINPEMFYKIVPPSFDMKYYWTNIKVAFAQVSYPQNHRLMSEFNGVLNHDPTIQLMQQVEPIQKHIFSKLTIPELEEFLNLYHVEYQTPYKSRFILSDLASRAFQYFHFLHKEKMILTWPVMDLVHLSKIDLPPVQQYPLSYLQSMNQSMIPVFASALKLNSTDPNVRERIIRLLRMMYLILLD